MASSRWSPEEWCPGKNTWLGVRRTEHLYVNYNLKIESKIWKSKKKYWAAVLSPGIYQTVILGKSSTSFVKMEIMLTLQGCFKVQVRQYKYKDPRVEKIVTTCEFPTFLWKSHIIYTNDAFGASPWLTMSYVKWQCCSCHLLVILILLSIPGISWKPLTTHFLLFSCVVLGGYFISLAPGLLPSGPCGDR